MTYYGVLEDNNLQNAIANVQEETIKVYHYCKQRTMDCWELDAKKIL